MTGPRLCPEHLTLLQAGAGLGPGVLAAQHSARDYFPALKWSGRGPVCIRGLVLGELESPSLASLLCLVFVQLEMNHFTRKEKPLQ